MKILASLVALLSTGSLLAASAPPAHKTTTAAPARSPAPASRYQRDREERFHNSAPADEYFGKMKMSYLGINNTFRDAAISSGDHTTNDAIVNKVALADDALRDWAKHFPRDPQLARSYYLAFEIQRKIWLRPNQEAAWTYMNRIAQLFPASYFGKVIKKDLAIGFTEHYYANALPCATPPATPEPTPTPSATPTPAPGRGRATPKPTPTATPTPEPPATPSPTPSPVPTPQALGHGLKVLVETPPCVPPATPTPSPSPTPQPTLAPAASPLPASPVPVRVSPLPSGSPAPTLPSTLPLAAPSPSSRPS